MERFVKESIIHAPVETVFEFHQRPGAVLDLTPPWERLEIVSSDGSLEPGSRTVFRMRFGPFSRMWVAEHTEYERNRLFADRQVRGPFAYWYHRHVFEPSNGSTVYRDEVEYSLPGGWIGRLLAGAAIRRRLERMFEYRHRAVATRLSAEPE